MSDETTNPPVEITVTPVEPKRADGLDITVGELVRRLAHTGSRLQVQFHINLQTGTGVPFRFVGYPVPGGFRLEASLQGGCPMEYFEAIVRTAGFEPHPEDRQRWFRMIELPPV